MKHNLIRNNDFSEGTSYWTISNRTSSKTVEFLSSHNQNASGIKLIVPQSEAPTQSTIFQDIPMMAGNTYTISFKVKREGFVEAWVELTANGIPILNQAFITNIENGADHEKVSAQVMIPGVPNTITLAKISLNAGFASGTAWFESVEIFGEKVFLPFVYVETNANVTIHMQAGVSDVNYGKFPANAKFIYDATDGDWVAVLFGRRDGMTQNAYIHKSDCFSGSTSLEIYPEWRMRTIAQSLVGVYGVQLGLDGDYCESFVHWLAGACDLSNDVYCGSDVCGNAVKYYTSIGIYGVRNSTDSLLMGCGDIAYYDVKNYGTDQVTAAHAGYVVNRYGVTYTAIEGNVSGEMKNRQYQIAIVTGNEQTGINSVHSRILHGAAHPAGRG